VPPVRREVSDQAIKFDSLRVALFIFHLAIMGYVTLGCGSFLRGLPSTSTPAPAADRHAVLLIAALDREQYRESGRVGQWTTSTIGSKGFFKTLLQAIGVPASQAQITTACAF